LNAEKENGVNTVFRDPKHIILGHPPFPFKEGRLRIHFIYDSRIHPGALHKAENNHHQRHEQLPGKGKGE